MSVRRMRPTDKLYRLAMARFPSLSEALILLVIRFFDLVTTLQFGPEAPKKYELLFVDPRAIERGYKVSRPHHLGVVRKN